MTGTTPVTTSDIIIIGAGPAGLGLARSLAGSGLSVTIVERQALGVLQNPPEDGRDIALTHHSENLMRELGIWDHLDAAEIGTIRDAKVMNGRSGFALHFDAKEQNADYLGRILPNHSIRRASFLAVQGQDGVEILTEAVVARVETGAAGAQVHLEDGRVIQGQLVVAADSRFSETRRAMGIGADMVDFGRAVIVCEVTHTRDHDDVAYECFHWDRTLAVLPMPGRKSSVVVTLAADEVASVMAQDGADFARDIAARFGGKLGEMALCSPRHVYPLVGVYARQFVARRFALVGDAAVGMHPVTAHGYNLGLRGADRLAREITAAHLLGDDFAGAAVLARYERDHRKATRLIYHGTNALVRLYTDQRLPARIARGAMLRLGAKLPPVRRAIVGQLTQHS